MYEHEKNNKGYLKPGDGANLRLKGRSCGPASAILGGSLNVPDRALPRIVPGERNTVEATPRAPRVTRKRLWSKGVQTG